MNDMIYRAAMREAYCTWCSARPGERCISLATDEPVWPPHGARLRFLDLLHAEINAIAQRWQMPSPVTPPMGEEGRMAPRPPGRLLPPARRLAVHDGVRVDRADRGV